MSRRKQNRGKLALRLGFASGLTTAVGFLILTAALIRTFAAELGPEPGGVVGRAWMFGGALAVVFSGLVGTVAAFLAGSIGRKLVEIGSAVGRIGRSEVRIRVGGEDEVGDLARSVQHLASDIGSLTAELQEGSGSAAPLDPQVRQLRDLTLEEDLAQPAGYEVDGVIAPGSRGGIDYFGSVEAEGKGILYAVSAEGAGPLAVVALRMARDEIVRALKASGSARKALAHTNRVMYRTLPRGVCAKAAVVELGDDQAELFQAGYRPKLWICSAGEVLELESDGLALGLDQGPVFDKALRSEPIAVATGVRLVVTNEAGSESQVLLDLVQEHSPKHTAPFLNLVAGGLEDDAGDDGLTDDVMIFTAKRF